MLQGAVLSAGITVLSFAFAVPIALVAGLGLLARPRPIRIVARIYVEFWRGTSVIVQLFWAYFVPPLFGIEIGAVETGVIVLSLNVGAYGSEIVRGAVQAVPRGQWEACTALNIPTWKSIRRIIVPQAVPGMVPPFGNLIVETLKATALLSLIAVPELTSKAYMLVFSGENIFEVYGLVLGIYFLIALPMTLGTFRIDRHLRRGYAGRGNTR